ncbi:PaaI family thioesterase [Seohaeicola saemankumensis]|nr:PaaI family thioesterase [Seohaeicola saemankumensis]MCA0873535.1 PaaI family thioesterase [Seohaeicola saemankumensis]
MNDKMEFEAPYPLQAHLGFRQVDWQPDFARFELPLAEFLTNRYGIPHGGIYATMLDTVMGFCGCYTGDPEVKKLGMTLSMNVNFLSRPKGELLICDGFKTGGGNRTFFARGEIRDELGTEIATGTGVFRYRTMN